MDTQPTLRFVNHATTNSKEWRDTQVWKNEVSLRLVRCQHRTKTSRSPAASFSLFASATCSHAVCLDVYR